MNCAHQTERLRCFSKERFQPSMGFTAGWAALRWIRSATSRSAIALRAAAFCPRFDIQAACLEIRLVKCRLKTLFRTAAARKQADLTAGVITAASALTRSMIA